MPKLLANDNRLVAEASMKSSSPTKSMPDLQTYFMENDTLSFEPAGPTWRHIIIKLQRIFDPRLGVLKLM
jgi:hypothetical protein